MRGIFATALFAAIIGSACAIPVSMMGADKVAVNLYFESYCPGCRDFITSELPSAIASVGDIMTVSFFPYGNAKEQDGQIVCQHGADECTGNIVESCMLTHIPDFTEHFAVLKCMEEIGEAATDFAQCAKQNSISADVVSAINKCASGSEGKDIEQAMKKATDALQPAHQFVPWVTVNGQALGQDLDQLVQYVCKAYTGTKPSACN
mmetsp:Transcript_35827/g.93385  ORF Transcript_35827/g.93385 Transcript_35827/m.93385 type:complete len:206 (-) Transcript_35827:204-821(-)|eukprot:CAMPEP_0113880100 /NCGR_PEP_ID=MMETSP0780_2-20120614/7601_1 /TAXON_ID=652834 /ORGANISM="Palpitomonas bilix" /LENGTH=205 /DNA_ID=CAMNT_0000866745 /DNA_START=38 /DNA_END=655 /DNA_ORIENTATION=- /assembly_acc=CAM_ASM_000599